MRLCLIVFVFHLLNISVSEHLVPLCQCYVWSLKQAKEVIESPRSRESHENCSSIIGSLFYSAELKIVFFFL